MFLLLSRAGATDNSRGRRAVYGPPVRYNEEISLEWAAYPPISISSCNGGAKKPIKLIIGTLAIGPLLQGTEKAAGSSARSSGAEWREAASMYLKEDQRVKDREETELKGQNMEEADHQEADILEEIEIEDFAVDGICGVY